MKKVLVIGAGISGLTALAVLKEAGHDVLCVDQRETIGGQWVDAFEGVLLQNSKDDYCFPGFDYPQGAPRYGGKEDVLQYWNSFVDARRLRGCLCLSTRLCALDRHSDKWNAVLRPAATGEETSHIFDFVVVATGQTGHSQIKNEPPPMKGRETFTGEVKHIIDYPPGFKPDPGSTVAVVGFGATSVGLATIYQRECPDVQVHHVYRQTNWCIPRFILGIIPFRFLLFSRATAMMTPAWYYGTDLEKFIHCPTMAWFVTLFWSFVGFILLLSNLVPPSMWPRDTFLSSLRTRGSVITPPGFFPAIRSGKIKPHCAGVRRLGPGRKVLLSNGDTFEADHIVLGTGYAPNPLPFLHRFEDARQMLEEYDWQLYRHMVHPDLPDMAFVGLATGFITCLTEYVQSVWISELVCDELDLPDRDSMLSSMRETLDFKRAYCPRERAPGGTACGRHMNYVDELLGDLNADAKRKDNWAHWLVAKINSNDYAGLTDEVRETRKLRKPLAGIA